MRVPASTPRPLLFFPSIHPSTLHQPPQPTHTVSIVTAEARRLHARAPAIEAFSNFRSAEAPGWTEGGGSRGPAGLGFDVDVARTDATRTMEAVINDDMCQPALSASAASAAGRRRHRSRRLGQHDFLPEGRRDSAASAEHVRFSFGISFLSAAYQNCGLWLITNALPLFAASV